MDFVRRRLDSRLVKLLRINWRLAKGALLGAVLVSAGYTLYSNDFDLSSYGVVRIGRAGLTVCTIAADYKVSRWLLQGHQDYEKRMSTVHLRNARRMLRLAKKNGGCYIKVGQHMASLDYLLPVEYINVLSELRASAPVSSFHDVLRVINEDLGAKAKQIVSINPKPVGSASLAQVHKAQLEDGTYVALKVQHKRVKRNSLVDIVTMDLLTRAVAATFSDFKFQWLAEEMKRNLPAELDFRSEGENADRIRRMYKHLSFLKVPTIFWEFTTDRILTMEFCDGAFITDLDYVKANNISPDEVCENLTRLYSEMIFIDGYVHCDPHPGNLLINKNDDGSCRITLLDHGLYTTLDEDFRLTYAKLWLAILSRDDKMIRAAAKALNVGDMYSLFACMVSKRSWKAITAGVDRQPFTTEESKEIRSRAPDYVQDMINVLGTVSRPMILIFKTNDLLKNINQALLPKFSASATYLHMLRFCLQATYSHALHNCRSWKCILGVHIAWWAALLRLHIYKMMLVGSRILAAILHHVK